MARSADKLIARRLGDEIGQTLVALCWTVDGMITRSHDGNTDELKSLRTELGALVKRIRLLGDELRPEELEPLYLRRSESVEDQTTIDNKSDRGTKV